MTKAAPKFEPNPRDLVSQVMADNPHAALGEVQARVRKKLYGPYTNWLDSFIDYTTESLYRSLSGRAAPPVVSRRSETVVNFQKVSAERSEKERQTDRAAGRTKYEKARDSIMAMRFANGKDILNQTVADVGKLGSWATAILKALPKTAKSTDIIGKHLTLDQLTKLRTFEA